MSEEIRTLTDKLAEPLEVSNPGLQRAKADLERSIQDLREAVDALRDLR